MKDLKPLRTRDVPMDLKRSAGGVILVPQPSDDPSFIGVAQVLANTSGFFIQAEVYHKSALNLSYSVNLPNAPSVSQVSS